VIINGVFGIRMEDIIDLDHGGIPGLGDDDHAGYLWGLGRSGGQILYGGGTGDDLELYSNSANDGKIYAGANNYFDESTDILHLVDGLVIGDGKTIGTTTTPAALTLSSIGSLFVTSTRVGTDEGTYNYILGTPVFGAKSGYTYNTIVGYNIANAATGDVYYNSITGFNIANAATGNVNLNSMTGFGIANTATGSVYLNSITGFSIANTATGSVYRNSITGYNIANAVTGSVYRNSITGDSIANTAIGDVYYNSITGLNIANTATGNVYYNSITGLNIANAATGNVTYNSITGLNIANAATGSVSNSFSVGQYNLYNTTNAVDLTRVIALPYEALRESSATTLDDAIAIGYRSGYQNLYNSPMVIGRQATATANNQGVFGSSFYTGGLLFDNFTQITNHDATAVGLTVKGYAAQAAPLLEIQKSDGTVYTAFDAIGQVSGAVEQQIAFMGGF